jgi:hypothetical protein
MRIKLMADYQCSPLWWDGEPDRVGDIDPADLGLPVDLCAALYAWAARFDATLHQDDPAASGFPSKAALDAFIEDGRILAQQVRAALGGNAELRYLPPEA